MDTEDVDRLRAHAGLRLVAVPDTDGDVAAALVRLEELLLGVVARETDEPEHPSGPGQLASGPTLAAVQRLGAAVAEAERGAVAQPVAPDGRYELVPMAWATVQRADLVQLGLGVEAIGRAWGIGGDEMVAEAVVEAADASRMKPVELVAEAARLHGLLSLPWDEEVHRLATALPAGAGRVVLDAGAHASYQAIVDRILGIWHAGDALAGFVYRGR